MDFKATSGFTEKEKLRSVRATVTGNNFYQVDRITPTVKSIIGFLPSFLPLRVLNVNEIDFPAPRLMCRLKRVCKSSVLGKM